jgi:hypothetical protein
MKNENPCSKLPSQIGDPADHSVFFFPLGHPRERFQKTTLAFTDWIFELVDWQITERD